MFNYWNRIDALNQVNRVLVVFIVLLALLAAGLIAALSMAPKKMEFWLAPGMGANGGLMKAGEVPDEYVHGFVTSLVPSLNTWSQMGKEEFAANIQSFHYYFTPRHQALMTETLTAYQQAQLFNRAQVASLYRFLEPADVKRLSSTSWEVHVVLRITQRLNDKSPLVIADKIVDYHLRVVKVTLSRLLNPFQLALDGYTKPERLVKDLLSLEKAGDDDAR
ncbi:DUF2895 family protein [Legionella feeleii]|uniref:Integrating conjugative element protein, PFL_4703 family n=1 Tax=Legionella feeleii TaxID=453 RepID=A0A0W0TH39_9GAMM|nr:DUF2895 family protein [Legionella feeleii]KTC94864.1 hypothetical protein Lfee_2528 [Legionella feeleii]SPX62052.1 integrating conjugative element protein, PFL_4703 family [Legionella feeleii]